MHNCACCCCSICKHRLSATCSCHLGHIWISMGTPLLLPAVPQVYRLHCLLPDTVIVHSTSTGQPHTNTTTVPLEALLFKGGTTVNKTYPLPDLLYTLGVGKSAGVSCNNSVPQPGLRHSCHFFVLVACWSLSAGCASPCSSDILSYATPLSNISTEDRHAGKHVDKEQCTPERLIPFGHSRYCWTESDSSTRLSQYGHVYVQQV